MQKFAIIYGDLTSDIQKRAVEELTSILLDYTHEYPACIKYEEDKNLDNYRCIYVGTKQTNEYIRKTSPKALSIQEEYYIKVENNTSIIEGFDDAGVLYGVLDFYNKYIVDHEYPNTNKDKFWTNFLKNEDLPSFEYCSSPSVKERGLWTWGHVIYDYKGYLDNMMKLKMNRVIIWNDFVPINAKEIIEYAHARNIKVIWGIAWLWDTNCKRFDLKNLEGKSEQIFAAYEKEYADVVGDGIYFQTFTELHTDNIDGVLIADAAAKFVNRTVALFYNKYPHLEIQFGLHATSVKTRLEFIKTVDPRVRIVWEDCGAFPFSYIPADVADFVQTEQFVQTIAQLRGENDRFGAITKGFTKLDWLRFEHLNASHLLGVSSNLMRETKIAHQKRTWRYMQAHWLANADKAYEAICQMYRLKNGDLCIFALVEDGLFEENIMYPVALYSEMLWDCNAELKSMMSSVALRSYVSFA